MKIKFNQDLTTPFGKFKKEDILVIATDGNNIPLDSFWRNRLEDAIIDNCIEIINDKLNKK
jgi:hypothetical protein